MIITKTKSQLRAESEAQLKEFLRRGGVVEVDERRARIPKAKMRGKTSKGFVQGSSGFAMGYPRKTGLV
jgi:hypothetical protein